MNWKFGPPWRKLFEGGVFLATLVPCALAVVIIRDFSINTPHTDEWEVVPLIAKLRLGGLTFSDLWQQHFEHRVLFLNLIILALAKLGPWNTVREIYLGFGFNVLYLLTLWALLRETSAPARGLLLLFSSLLLFSAAQSQNLTWGWQVSWFLNNFLFVAAVWVLARWPGRLLALAAGWLCLAIGSYATGTELAGWPAILFGLIVHRRWPASAVVLWIIGAVVVMTLYLKGLYLDSGKYLSALQHPGAFLQYVLGFLGTPFALNSRPQTAPRYGALALLGCALPLAWAWRKRFDLDDHFWHSLIPWLQLAFFAVGNAVMAATSRTNIELPEGAGRFATVANTIWIADAVMFAFVLKRFFSKLGRGPQFALALMVVVAVVSMTIGYVKSYRDGFEEIEEEHSRLQLALAFLHDFESVEDVRIGPLLWNNIPSVRRGAATLKQLREGPFQLSRDAYLRTLAERWKPPTRSPSGSDSFRRYPANAFQMTLGAQALFKRAEAGELEFVVTDTDGVNFEVDGTFLNQSKFSFLPGIVNRQALTIKSKAAQYINIFWEPAKFWGIRNSSAYASVDGDGHRYFGVYVPPGVETFRLDLHYDAQFPIADRVTVDVYDRR